MILANGCNITKSEKCKGSEYFPYPLYVKGSSQAFLLNKSTEVALNVISNGVLRYLI